MTDTEVTTPEGQVDEQPDTALEDYEFTDNEESTEETTEEAQEEAPAEEVPVQLTSEQIMQQAEERAFQRMASWSGRRDKELLDTIGGLIDSKFTQTRQVTEPSEPSSILDDPDGWAERKIRQLAPRVMYEEAARATTAERNYNSSLIQHAGRMMDNDEMFKDREYGNQVIQEIQSQFSSINKNLPPDVNAELLINKAVTSLARKGRAMKGNALAGNTGVKAGVGGVGAPSVTRKSVNVPKLSPEAQRLAQRWNYKPEDLERVFKEH